MTQGFDEWYRDARDITAKAGWDAGQQSRQSEIDELQKRIDDVIKHIEPSDEISHKLYREVCTILKGINK